MYHSPSLLEKHTHVRDKDQGSTLQTVIVS